VLLPGPNSKPTTARPRKASPSFLRVWALGGVLAALDAGDRRVAGTHALSQLLLGDPESGAMPDDQPGKFLELNKTLLLAPGPLVSKLAEAGANRAKRRSVRWSVPSWEPKGGCG
jgi:hypothetical protein